MLPRKNPLALLVGAALLSGLGTAAAGPAVNGPMAFNPLGKSAEVLTNDWDQPHLIPDGYEMYKVADETDLNIYVTDTDGTDIGRDFPDLSDMNTVNETGPQAGRFLYRTHEVDECGAVSVVDLDTGAATVIAQASDCAATAPAIGPQFPDFTLGRDLDGIRWTPWGTVLFAEEDPQGRVYELILDPKDPTVAADVVDRPAVGRIRHEGIEVGADGAVYVIDELNGGSIFRFVPDAYGDLSTGQLYALKLTGLSDAEQSYGSGHDHLGPFEWVALDRDQVRLDAKVAADWVEATEFGRPEDVEAIGRMLYVAETSEDRVLAIDLNRQVVTAYVSAGDNAPAGGNPDFNNPDNLAEGPDGRLWIVEDTGGSDIWVADRDLDGDGKADGVHLFAAMVDSGAEGTGIYFGKDPHTLYVNVQHAAKEYADGTWAITRRDTQRR